jgi:hypothetical protein
MLLQMCCPRMQCRCLLHREDMLLKNCFGWMDCKCLLDKGCMMAGQYHYYRYLLHRQDRLH